MSDLSERDALAIFVEGMRKAEEAARIVAHYRRDPSWIKISSLIANVREKASVMAVKGLITQ